MENREILSAALDALDRLLKMFMIERYVYLALSAVSFLMVIFVAYPPTQATSLSLARWQRRCRS